MSQITVESTTIGDWNYPFPDMELRILAASDFITSDDGEILRGDGRKVYQRVPCGVSLASRTITISAFTIDSTTDARQGANEARYFAWFYRANGTKVKLFDNLPDGFKVPPTNSGTTTFTWADLVAYNRVSVANHDFSAYTKPEIDRKFDDVNSSIGTVNNPVLSGQPTPSLPTGFGRLQIDTLTGRITVGNGSRAIPLTPAVNVQSYPFLAKGDGVLTTASMTNGSPLLTLTSGSFAPTDVGKLVDVAGAGSGGKNLVGAINAVVAGVATLSVNAGTTVTNAVTLYGTNDRAAIQAAIDTGLAVYIPSGYYIINSVADPGGGLEINAPTGISGAGMWATVLYAVGPIEATEASTWFNILNLNTSKFTLRDVGLSGTNWSAVQAGISGYSADGLRASHVDGDEWDVQINSCRFDYFWSIGCHALGLQKRWTVTNSEANYNAADGFNLNVDGLIFLGNRGTGNATAMLEASGDDMVVCNNNATLNRGSGMSIGGGTYNSRCVVSNNLILENLGSGIAVADIHASIFSGNVCRRNEVSGILLINILGTDPGLNVVSQNIISSNSSGGSGSGILVVQGGNLLEDNYIYDEAIPGFPQYFGIQVTTGVDGTKLLRNHVTGSANKDYLLSGATNILFVNEEPTSTIQAIGTTFIYPSPTFDDLIVLGDEAVSGSLSVAGGIIAGTSTGAASFAHDYSAGDTLSVNNNATAKPFGNAINFSGLIIINDPSITGSTGVFLVGNSIVLIGDSSGSGYSVTSGTPGKTNVFLSSSIVTIENKTGGTVTYRIAATRMRSQL